MDTQLAGKENMDKKKENNTVLIIPKPTSQSVSL